MSVRDQLVEKFRGVDAGIRDALSNEESELKLGLAVLVMAKEKFGVEYLNLEEITECLDRIGVAVERGSLGRSFSKAAARIRRKKVGSEVLYKAMHSGRQFVGELFDEAGPQVAFIEAGKPRTARKKLKELLGGFDGEIRVCDPYFGIKSLDALEYIPKKCVVQLLTVKVTDPMAKVTNAVQDFKKEYPNVAIGVFPHGGQIHDRYVMSSKEVLLVGHGIKDIGNKESFIVRVEASLAGDLIKSLQATFDDRWKHVSLL